jgi:hypothetical protein
MIKLIAVVGMVLICLAGPSWSQTTGRIALTSSADGSDCAILDGVAGNVEIHIVILDVMGVAGVQFAAPIPDCWTGATWVSDNIQYLIIGGTQDPVGGLSIAFGACLDGPVYVGSITVFTLGQCPSCCPFPVIKATNDHYPEFPGPIVAVCGENWSTDMYIAGVSVDAVINPDEQCPCATTIPVETTTWGAVKAVYR